MQGAITGFRRRRTHITLSMSGFFKGAGLFCCLTHAAVSHGTPGADSVLLDDPAAVVTAGKVARPRMVEVGEGQASSQRVRVVQVVGMAQPVIAADCPILGCQAEVLVLEQ